MSLGALRAKCGVGWGGTEVRGAENAGLSEWLEVAAERGRGQGQCLSSRRSVPRDAEMVNAGSVHETPGSS